MTLTQQQRVGLTVFAVLLGITIIVAGFVHRIQQPRIMTTVSYTHLTLPTKRIV